MSLLGLGLPGVLLGGVFWGGCSRVEHRLFGRRAGQGLLVLSGFFFGVECGVWLVVGWGTLLGPEGAGLPPGFVWGLGVVSSGLGFCFRKLSELLFGWVWGVVGFCSLLENCIVDASIFVSVQFSFA